VENSPSSLRKLADNELDSKYDARKISRVQLDNWDDDEEPLDDGLHALDDASDASIDSESASEGSVDDDHGSAGSDDSDRQDTASEAELDTNVAATTATTTTTLKQSRQVDIAKGKSVARQRVSFAVLPASCGARHPCPALISQSHLARLGRPRRYPYSNAKSGYNITSTCA
jgi:protein AATF/BFR2